MSAPAATFSGSGDFNFSGGGGGYPQPPVDRKEEAESSSGSKRAAFDNPIAGHKTLRPRYSQEQPQEQDERFAAQSGHRVSPSNKDPLSGQKKSAQSAQSLIR